MCMDKGTFMQLEKYLVSYVSCMCTCHLHDSLLKGENGKWFWIIMIVIALQDTASRQEKEKDGEAPVGGMEEATVNSINTPLIMYV